MVDTVDRTERSRIMRLVRSSGNKSTEAVLVGLLRKARLTGWRRRLDLPGRPDFAFPTSRLAIFVDGCFWHGCPKHLRLPATNRRYWVQKIGRNVARDRAVRRALTGRAWRVVRIWEHDLTTPLGQRRTVLRIRRCSDPSRDRVRQRPRRADPSRLKLPFPGYRRPIPLGRGRNIRRNSVRSMSSGRFLGGHPARTASKAGALDHRRQEYGELRLKAAAQTPSSMGLDLCLPSHGTIGCSFSRQTAQTWQRLQKPQTDSSKTSSVPSPVATRSLPSASAACQRGTLPV